MANRYWVGNGGSWSNTAHWSTTSGGAGGASIPTSADNVYFNANSFTSTGHTVNVDVEVYCLDMDWTGATNNPTFNLSSYLHVGSLTFINNMIFNHNYYDIYIGNVNSYPDKNNFVVSAGKDLGIVNFMNNCILQDNLICYMMMFYGSFSTNDKNITSEQGVYFESQEKYSVNFGSSVITSNNVYLELIDDLTFDAGTSTIKLTGNGEIFNGQNLTYHAVHFLGNQIITGSNTFNTVIINKGLTINIEAGSTQTITNNFRVMGAAGNLCVFQSSLAGSHYTLNIPIIGSYLVNYASFKDCYIDNGTLIIYNSTNVSGNSGIAFQAGNPLGRYWVGGTGNWSDITHWSTTSGGTGGASVPTSTDNVYFDANSFTATGQTVTVDVTANCLDMDWTGTLYNPTLTSSAGYPYIYGNLIFIKDMTVSGTSTIYMKANGHKIIATNGVIISWYIRFDNASGIWHLQDDFIMTGSSKQFFLVAGIVNTNNYKITAPYGFQITGSSVLNCGSSIISTGWFNISGTADLSDATVNIISGYNYVLSANGRTIKKLVIEANVKLEGSMIFDTLEVKPGVTVTITQGTTQIIDNLKAIGTAGYLCTFQSYTSGSYYTINKSTSTRSGFIVDYCSFKDCNASVSIDAYNSTNVSGNSKITFQAGVAPIRYWVGGTGNWSSNGHWSTTSGGAGGASIPTSADNVYFDANSFTAAGQIVTIDTEVNCLDMDWTGALYNPTLKCTIAYFQNIYGSLTLIPSMNMSGAYVGSFLFKSIKNDRTITTADKIFYGVSFQGIGGGWTLQDDMVLLNNLTLSNGILNTNSKNISCVAFNANGSEDIRTLTLGSSVITASGNLYFSTTGLTLTNNTSTFKLTGYYTTLNGGGATLNNVEFRGIGNNLVGSITCNELTIVPGNTLTITSGTIQTVKNLNANGTINNLVSIVSSIIGSPATISCPNNLIYVKYCSIKDITATGLSSFNAIKCTNVSGNSGWNFVDSIKIGNLLPATFNNTGLLSHLDKEKLYTLANKNGNTMQGALVAQSNTNYTTKQVRNIILSSTDPVLSSMENGDIWIKYE